MYTRQSRLDFLLPANDLKRLLETNEASWRAFKYDKVILILNHIEFHYQVIKVASRGYY